jgi:hypothetical protein
VADFVGPISRGLPNVQYHQRGESMDLFDGRIVETPAA